jgi:hypothetical protein
VYLNYFVVFTNRITEHKLVNFRKQGRILTDYSRLRKRKEIIKSEKPVSAKKSVKDDI